MARPKRHGPDDLIAPEVVPIESLTPHTRNYREHPDDQVQHLMASLEQFGQFRNVVVARDGTILAGHGVVEAAWRLDWPTIEVRRLDLAPDDPNALKLLALDNELSRFAVNDDRALTELLAEIRDQSTAGLVGTGYDEMMLANLLMVTRPAHEIADLDEAAAWAGLPEFVGTGKGIIMIVRFDTDDERQKCLDLLGITNTRKMTTSNTWSVWWPPRDREDKINVAFDG